MRKGDLEFKVDGSIDVPEANVRDLNLRLPGPSLAYARAEPMKSLNPPAPTGESGGGERKGEGAAGAERLSWRATGPTSLQKATEQEKQPK